MHVSCKILTKETLLHRAPVICMVELHRHRGSGDWVAEQIEVLASFAIAQGDFLSELKDPSVSEDGKALLGAK